MKGHTGFTVSDPSLRVPLSGVRDDWRGQKDKSKKGTLMIIGWVFFFLKRMLSWQLLKLRESVLRGENRGSCRWHQMPWEYQCRSHPSSLSILDPAQDEGKPGVAAVVMKSLIYRAGLLHLDVVKWLPPWASPASMTFSAHSISAFASQCTYSLNL